jgi:predicted transcriptional regulator
LLGQYRALRDDQKFSKRIYQKLIPIFLDKQMSIEIFEAKELPKHDLQIEPEAITNVLTLAKYGISQNEVMTSIRSASSLDMKTFVGYLVSIGLIQIVKASRNSGPALLYTTEKGFKFLRSYNTLVELAGGTCFKSS